MAIIKNKVHSVLERIRNKAKTSCISYQHALQLFMQEEFLRRLSNSPYKENLVLKGGLLIFTLSQFSSRVTVDIDFLLRGMQPLPEYVRKMIEAVIAVNTGNDFITFSIIKLHPIAIERKYPGLSIQLMGKLSNIKVPFSVDLGVGDIITPRACEHAIYTMLPEFEAPNVFVYSLESIIAEKLDAMIQRLSMNSRMKDFFDVYFLSRYCNFGLMTLSSAIKRTLMNRGTLIRNESLSNVLSLVDDADMQKKWISFLRVQNREEPAFCDVIRQIDRFLSPVWDSICTGSSAAIYRWNAETNSWQ